MKKIFLGLILFTLSGCAEGSTAKGFWGPSNVGGVWDQESTSVCENYNSCHESCELYGNCE